MPSEDDVLPAEEQPLPTAVSPTADSPGYVPESDPEEDPEEDDDEDPKEDPSDYPTDRDDDNEEEEPSRDKADDEEEEEDDEEEKEEHLAPPDSTTVAFPAVDHIASAEETKPFETDEFAATPPPHPAYRVTARITIRAQTPIPSLPLPSILSPLPVSPPLPISSLPLPTSATYPLGYRTAMIRLRAETPSTSHPLLLPPPIVLPHTRAYVTMMRATAPSTYILAPRSRILPSDTPPSWTPPLLPIPLPTPSAPLLLPSTDYRAGVSEATLLPQKRLFIALGLRYEVGKSSFASTARPTGGCRVDYGFVGTLDDEIRRYPKRYVGYGITDTWEDMVEDVQGILVVTDVAKLSQRMMDFVMTIRQDTDEIYKRLDDAHDDRLLMSGRLNTLFRDRRAHAHVVLLIKREARLSRGSIVVGDCRVAGSRSHPAGITCRDSETDEYTADTSDSTPVSVGTR
ncbi:hypothetical protein Tco_0390380 [Tanacetum coccineum]